MEFFASAIKGTLTIPEPIFPTTSSHHHHHPHPTVTALPPPPPGHPGHEHHNVHFASIGDTGKKALWVFTVIFGVASLITFLLSKRVERKLRLFHNITGVIIVTAFLSYLAMSTGLGVAYTPSYTDHHEHGKVLRQVFYARYIDWAITTPLLLLDLALLAGLPLTTTILLMLADEAMIITGLIAGLSRSGEFARWVFFAVSCGFYAYVLLTLVFAGRQAASLQSSNVQKIYLVTMLMTVVLWTGYPIIFALTEGKGIVSPDVEVIAYGILDVMAKVVFGMYLLIAHSHTEGDSVVISEFWTEPRSGRGYGAISDD